MTSLCFAQTGQVFNKKPLASLSENLKNKI